MQEFIRERVEAMAVFKAFVASAQAEFVAAERARNPAAVEFRVRSAQPAGVACWRLW
jgi:hypothetical protein